MTQMLKHNITDSLVTNFMPYSAYVILYRALPEIDGFKPSQRRILYTMYLMGLLNSNRKKSQGVVGSTMFLHPHGDGAIYEAMVRMATDNEALLLPYINSKGNFGKQYSRDMKYASARYTEVKLAKIAKELFTDINKNTVEMVDNYDSEMKEPKLLPVTFPNILTNVQTGTAVGMSTNIASFNLREVIDFAVAFIKNPKNVVVSDYIKAPDFPTGGNIIYNQKEMEKILDTGLGSVRIRATHTMTENSIIFEELPYETKYEAIIDRISALVKSGSLKEVIDVDDIYGNETKGIEIIVKKGTNKELLVEKLYKMTALEDAFSCNFNIVVNGRPQVLGVKQIVSEWVKFRANAIKRGTSFDISKKIEKRHLLLALKQVLLDVDKAIFIIRETKLNKDVVRNLMNEFKIDEGQAEYVAEIKLKHLNKEYLINRIAEIEEIDKEVEELKEIINNKSVLAKLIISQLESVKKEYGEERKSKIIEVSEIPTINIAEESIEDYNVKVFVTREGYLKKIPLTSLRGNFAIKVKDGDEIVKEFETTNNSDILVFTDKQNIYKYKSHELEDHKPSVLGEYLPSLLKLDGEEILFVTVTNDYTGNLLIGFEDGKVAKIELNAYETKQNRAMLKNAYADKKALYFNHIHEDIDVLAISSIDKALVFNTSMINSKTSKTTIGIQVLKSKNDSIATSYTTLNNSYEEAEYYKTLNAGVGKYLRKGDFEGLIK